MSDQLQHHQVPQYKEHRYEYPPKHDMYRPVKDLRLPIDLLELEVVEHHQPLSIL